MWEGRKIRRRGRLKKEKGAKAGATIMMRKCEREREGKTRATHPVSKRRERKKSNNTGKHERVSEREKEG